MTNNNNKNGEIILEPKFAYESKSKFKRKGQQLTGFLYAAAGKGSSLFAILSQILK